MDHDADDGTVRDGLDGLVYRSSWFRLDDRSCALRFFHAAERRSPDAQRSSSTGVAGLGELLARYAGAVIKDSWVGYRGASFAPRIVRLEICGNPAEERRRRHW